MARSTTNPDLKTMSPRKEILRQLNRADAPTGNAEFTRPSEIPGFAQEPGKYQKAVNRLLQERLIEGKKEADGHMVIALNRHKLAEVRRELRGPWASPMVWAAVAVLAALTAFFVVSGGGA
jgi:hypothetical protein